MNNNIIGFQSGETTNESLSEFIGAIIGTHSKWIKTDKNYSRNFGQGYRVYGINGKSVVQTAQGFGLAGHTGMYFVPVLGVFDNEEKN